MRLRAAVAVLAGLLTTLPVPARAAKPPTWLELRTPHFLVITNGKAKQARHIGLELERIRAALQQSFPGLQADTPDSMVVLALKDEASMLALVNSPEMQRILELQAGVFLDAREHSCLLLRLDREADDYHPAYHEYVHALLTLNFPRLPLWLQEGLAEFYADARFHAHQARIGADPRQTSYLRDRTLLPLATLRAVDPTSALYRDPARARLYYAESWGLIHFLIFGPGMEEGGKFSRYLGRLQRGDDEALAFAESFGPLPQVQQQLDQFRRRFALPALQLANLPAVDEQAFVLRPLPNEEWQGLQGSLQIPDRLSHSPAALPRH